MKPSFTLGIEEEYQTIDPETLDLRSHINTELIAQGKMLLKEKVKAEMHQSVIEVGTGICRTIGEARVDVVDLRRQTIRLAREQGLLLAAGATHPFADWRVQDIYPDERYLQVVEDMQTVARSNLIFGLHVHVGVEDRETSIHLMNQMRYFLPAPAGALDELAVLARDEHRVEVVPLQGFRQVSAHEHSRHVYELGRLRAARQAVDSHQLHRQREAHLVGYRPHPIFSTLEVRICDLPMRVDETLAIAALIQATVAKLYKLHSRNQGFRLYSRALIMENKWRAARYGLDGMMIDFGREKELPERELILEYLDFVDDVLDELECRKEVEYVQTILDRGTGADRQLKVFSETDDLKKVVDYMVSETQAGL